MNADIMKVKIDEDLPKNLAVILLERGYAVETVFQQGMSGWKDPDLWKTIQEEQRFLITADKGFGDIRVYPPGTHSGILLLRPDRDGILPITKLLESVVKKHDLSIFSGSITVATPRGIRVRHKR
jgi:predicted nuclease of predicted toxin-antitoxin system